MKHGSVLKSNGKKATVLLLVAFAGYVASFPFRGNLAGSLLIAFFAAALAGGIADWYGIVALFRKPLGIAFRTGIIPKSRDRLVEALISLVDSELLTKEVLKQRITRMDFSSEVINYFNQYGGRQDISAIISAIITDTAIFTIKTSTGPIIIEQDIDNKSDLSVAALKLSEKIKSILVEVNFKALLFQVSDKFLSSVYGHKLLEKLADEVMEVIMCSQLNVLFSDVIDTVLEEIQDNTKKKSLFKRGLTLLSFRILKSSGFRPGKIAGVLQEEACKYLKNIKDTQTTASLSITHKMTSVIDDLSLYISNTLKKDESIQKKIYGFLFSTIANTVLKDDSDIQFQLANKICDIFISDSNMRGSLNRFVVEYLQKLVDEKHEKLGEILREKLMAVSAEEFSRMLEEKAWDDLQIIRINGTLVGGFAGLLFALVNKLMERMIT